MAEQLTDIPILVVSCDRYNDLWSVFFEIFRKRWPDCPYKVYLGTNHINYDEHDVTTLCIGDDISWAANLDRMLDKIPNERVILFLEDFLLVSDVITREVEAMVQISLENDIDCLRLRPAPGPTKMLSGFRNLGIIEKGSDYRVSTQVAIWKIDCVRRLAFYDFSAWDFEVYGSIISDRMDYKFWSVFDPVIDYRHAVERGLWLQEGLDICRQSMVTVDLAIRSAISEAQRRSKGNLQSRGLRSIIKRMLPESVVRKLKYKYRSRRLDLLVHLKDSCDS